MSDSARMEIDHGNREVPMELPAAQATFGSMPHPSYTLSPSLTSAGFSTSATSSTVPSLPSSYPLSATDSLMPVESGTASVVGTSSLVSQAPMSSSSTSSESSVSSQSITPATLTVSQVSQLIEDLRSNDIPARINAFRSLPSIAAALGPQRTRDELVPYLQEFVDDDDEILLVLAQEIVTLANYVGGNNFAWTLIPPLEHLAATEESNVREKSVASIIQLSRTQSEAELETHFVPLCKKIANAEWFTSRISATLLIPALYPSVAANTKKEFRSLFARLCSDDTPMVRRAAATQLGEFAKVFDYTSLRNELFPCLSKLSKDEQDSVRLLTVQACVHFSAALRSADNVVKLLPIIFSLCTDKSWRVRYVVADKYVELCNSIGPQESKSDQLVDSFVCLVQDEEAEVRTAAVSHISELAKVIGASQTLKKLVPPLEIVVKDQSQYVRAAVASVIMAMTSVLQKEDIYSHLVPLFLQLLKDERSEVRLNIISRFETVHDVMSMETLSQSLLPAISELARDSEWRIRLQVIQQIPVLAKQLGREFFDSKLLELCMNWLGDSVYSIREAATSNLTRLAQVYGADWTNSHILPKIVSLGKHRSYLYRMTSIAAMGDLASTVGTASTIQNFLPTLLQLSADPVPNVRFNSLKCISKLARNGDLPLATMSKSMPDQLDKISEVVRNLIQDSDSDVRQHAHYCIDEIEKSTSTVTV